MKKRNTYFFLTLTFLPACASFPQFVKHADPLTPDQHMQLGASYEAQGQKGNAERQYEAALHLQKEFMPAIMAQGNLAFDSGDLKKAEACYRRVLRLDENHPGANNNLAMVYLTRGKDLDKGERYAKTALEQGGPLRPYALETLYELYTLQGRTSEAWKMREEADATAPSNNTVLCERLDKIREKFATSPH